MSREIARGAAWMVLFKLFDRLLGVFSTLILARLLVPADFGVVAMAMSVIAVIELASAFSFEIALIQKPHPQREHFDTAWTLNILLGLGCGLLIALLAYPASVFYDEPRLAAVMPVLAAAWCIGGFENVGTVEFRRQMDFSREFRFMASKRMVSFVVTIVLALVLRSYWALIAGMLVGRIAGVVFSYLLHPLRPRLSFAASRELFGFSGWLLVNNLLSVGILKAPHFFVGRLNGPAALGLYTIASELAYTPATEMMAPVNRALFPGFARLADDIAKFRATFIDVIAIILVVVVPASVGLAVVAEPMVRVLLGEKWLACVPLIQILAPAGAIVALTSNNVSAYFALGKTSLPPLILVVRVVVLLGALAILARQGGVVSIAQSELLAAIVSLAVSLPMLLKTLKLSAGDYIARAWRPFIASTAMGLGVHALLDMLGSVPSFGHELTRLSAGIVSGAAIYTLATWLLWRLAGKPHGAESILLDRVVAFVSARAPWLRRAG
jgi:O-antigen/teichoic acid export membrane protein